MTTTVEHEPPRPTVRAHKPLDPTTFADRAFVEPGSYEDLVAQELFATHREEARGYIQRLRRLAALWCDDDEDGDARAALVADSRRVTLRQARALLIDAFHAVTALPLTMARLAEGHIPVSWFELLLKKIRPLDADACRQIDDRVAEWDLENLRVDRFSRELSRLVTWFSTPYLTSPPESRRRVELEPSLNFDGTARLTVIGPIHEIVDLSHRLDAAARAVQDEQRHALEDGRPVPFDLDGIAARDGRHLNLAALRYAVLLRSTLDTGGIEVPGSHLRLQVIVPAMTLLGESDAPGTIDGTIPLPAPMARHLAAGESTWYRILTDPATGAFLPLPATRYSPTPAMQQHLRNLDPVCAFPGCTMNTCTVGESDHIEEYDHENPENGGQTAIENLHRLCWQHHDMKTRGVIDPVRNPDGSTTWYSRGQRMRPVDQNKDLLTPMIAADLQHAWEVYEEMTIWDECHRREMLRDAAPTDPPEGPSYPDPPF